MGAVALIGAGVLLVLSPFIVVTAIVVRDSGWREAGIVWGMVALIVGAVIGGLGLIALGSV
jgi:hypothetical protein